MSRITVTVIVVLVLCALVGIYLAIQEEPAQIQVYRREVGLGEWDRFQQLVKVADVKMFAPTNPGPPGISVILKDPNVNVLPAVNFEDPIFSWITGFVGRGSLDFQFIEGEGVVATDEHKIRHVLTFDQDDLKIRTKPR